MNKLTFILNGHGKLYLVCLSVEFNFVAFHDLLNGSSNVAKPDVDTGSSNTHLGGLQTKFDKINFRVSSDDFNFWETVFFQFGTPFSELDYPFGLYSGIIISD